MTALYDNYNVFALYMQQTVFIVVCYLEIYMAHWMALLKTLRWWGLDFEIQKKRIKEYIKNILMIIAWTTHILLCLNSFSFSDGPVLMHPFSVQSSINGRNSVTILWKSFTIIVNNYMYCWKLSTILLQLAGWLVQVGHGGRLVRASGSWCPIG